MNTIRAERSQYFGKETDPHKGQFYNSRSYFRKTNQNFTVSIPPRVSISAPKSWPQPSLSPVLTAAPDGVTRNCKENSTEKGAGKLWNLQERQDIMSRLFLQGWRAVCSWEKEEAGETKGTREKWEEFRWVKSTWHSPEDLARISQCFTWQSPWPYWGSQLWGPGQLTALVQKSRVIKHKYRRPGILPTSFCLSAQWSMTL